MMISELNALEYLSGVFKGLSVEKKDCVLDTARSLLKIQDENYHAVKNKTKIHNKRQNNAFWEISLAYDNEKNKRS